jgi:murein DD-endopeptidase MepM/ murein hydrolase activator NlpD
VNIYAPEDSYISFFNSPYYAHKENLAIDIYPPHNGSPVTAYSPVAGRIKKIYTFNPPTPKFFKGPTVEQLIILESTTQSDSHIRLLHIDSTLKVGTFVEVGDALGDIVRSGFYHFWTAPHLHVEVRIKDNLIRAKGSEPMIPNIDGKKIEDNRRSSDATYKVAVIEENYSLLQSGEASKIGCIYGMGCTVGRDWGIY